MKWLIASDIHGSSYYCEKLLQAFQAEKADRILLLGDTLYHGPRNALPRDYDPMKVVELLSWYKDITISVRGNCDAEIDQMVLPFPIMADYTLLPVGERVIFVTHGHIYNEETLPPLHPGDILLHGHTHVATCVDHGNYIYCNPGSTSIPKENTPHGYMILDGTTLYWKDLEKDPSENTYRTLALS